MGKRLNLIKTVCAIVLIGMVSSREAGFSAAKLPQGKIRVERHRLSVKENILKNLPATITIHLKTDDSIAVGSGAVIRRDGLVVTCYHVIEGWKEGFVRFPDGKFVAVSEVVSVDPVNDVALIKIDGMNFQAARIGDSSKIELGDEVVVIGSPLWLEATVSTGIVSAIRSGQNKIQFTAPISAGSSGGPLFNSYGEIIGIATSSREAGGSQNLNFATPSTEILKLVAQAPVPAIVQGAPERRLQESLEAALVRFLANNQNEQTRFIAARHFLKKGDSKKVLELVKETDHTEAAYYLRAKALLLEGKVPEAIKLFNKLPEAYFNNEPRLYLYKANLYLNERNLPLAKQALEKYNARSGVKDAHYYYTVGDLATAYAFAESRQLDQDQYFEKAIGFYEIAEEKNPGFTGATYRKGLVQLTMGDLNGANETYRALIVKDPDLGKRLEIGIADYIQSYNTSTANYYRELGKEYLRNSLALLVYGILGALAETGY